MQSRLNSQEDLFDAPQPGPEGFVYQPAFIDVAQEAALLEIFSDLPFRQTPYKEYIARRRTVSYGTAYKPGTDENHSIGTMPDFLLPLRDRFGAWAGVPAGEFVQALVSEYRPGTPLGWHRDMPEYEMIVGVSLGASCRMRFRPYWPEGKVRGSEILTLDLLPRSAYQMRGTARWGWQHSVMPTNALRYSITFRTARRSASR
ncbi:MAG TPA: alpha-ketoglutarate-dependent dioxygenase AlkB [Burkholderiales bacterium]|nr:alpha-ketoglutarate-dependent dioxygenase AlkB [Burkholderiales bacterium]